MKLLPFEMERYQSRYEHRVQVNLSESGVHPLTAAEVLTMAGEDDPGGFLAGIRLSYGQTNGSDELRSRIAALYPGATDAHVVATTGGAEANLAAFWRLADPGIPAAVLLPNYMQLPGLFENFGVPVLPFRLREELGWQPDLHELTACLEQGARTIVVTNPNNPTGSALTSEAIDEIVSLADRHGAWILADEVYSGAEVGQETSPGFWGRYDRLIVTNSLSKAYALPGLRLGWAVASPDVASDLWARTDYTTIVPATVSDRLARIALRPDVRPRILERTRTIVRENLGVTTEWMDAQDGLFAYRSPDAGAICYVRYEAPVNSTEFAERLRTEHSLLVVPGDHFGMDRYLRIGFGIPRGPLLEGLERMGEAFRAVRG